MKLHAFALIPLLALSVAAHANSATISYVETENYDSDPVVSFASGKLIKQDTNGAINHAVTAIGTNKLYGSGNGTSELNGASAWMDSYTVQGTGTVNVHLSFTVDGMSAVGANGGGDGHPFDWSYRVVAMKGSDWNLGGQGFTGVAPASNWPIRSPGDNYESLLLTHVTALDPTITTTFQPRFGGSTVWNVKNFGSDNAAFSPSFARNGNNISLYTDGPGNIPLRVLYTPTYMQLFNVNTNQAIGPQQPYATTQGGAGAKQTYLNLMAAYPVLAQTGLCTLDDETGLCPTQQTYGPTEMHLDFSLQAGEQFSLVSYLSYMNLRDGEFDFFNTAKLTGITLSDGATITSGSGALQQLAGGGYGYAPLTLGVPEPAQWALFIGGFGMIGGALRRRQRQAAKAASIAVGAPFNA